MGADLFMNGPDFGMRSKGRHSCYGSVDYGADGVDYVWNVDYDKCGTVNKTNSLKALTNEFTTGVEPANSFWMEFSCDNQAVINVNIDSTTDSGLVVKTMKNSMELDIDPAFQSRVETVSYIEKLTALDNADYYYSDIEISNLVTGANVNDGRSTVIVAQACSISGQPVPDMTTGIKIIEQ